MMYLKWGVRFRPVLRDLGLRSTRGRSAPPFISARARRTAFGLKPDSAAIRSNSAASRWGESGLRTPSPATTVGTPPDLPDLLQAAAGVASSRLLPAPPRRRWPPPLVAAVRAREP